MTDRLLASILVLAALSCGAAAQNWAQRSLAVSPPARNGAPAAYDLERGRTVLFGGFNGSGLADTWEFDGVAWQQRASATTPSARWGHGMVYDADSRQIVLFGGFVSGVGYVSDTWSWNGTAWTQLAPAASPSARGYHGMAYDAHQRRTLLFGGEANGGAFLGDTWTFDGSNWSPSPGAGPSARRGVAIAYDEARQRVVAFGGGAAAASAQTWAFDVNGWQLLSTPTAPSARWESTMVYDVASRGLVLMGGASLDYATKFSDTWTLQGNTWQQVVGAGPQARGYSSMAYDMRRARVVLFGGGGATAFLSDTWERQSANVTTWTGAVSTSAAVAGNWSNGVPTSTSTAVIPPTTRACASGFTTCDLVVASGSVSGLVAVGGNVDATGPGMTAGIEMSPAPVATMAGFYRCRAGATIASLGRSAVGVGQVARAVVDGVRTTGNWQFFSGAVAEVSLRGDVVIDGGINNGTLGSASITSSGVGSLTAAFLDTSASVFPPGNWNIPIIRLTNTSSFTPTGGTVRVRTGINVAVTFSDGGQMGAVVVEPGATMRMTQSSFGSNSAFVGSLDVRGTCEMQGAWTDIYVNGSTNVTGVLRANVSPGPGAVRFVGGTQVAAGGLLEVSGWVMATQPIVVDGTMRVGAFVLLASSTGFSGSPFGLPGSPGPTPTLLDIRPAGALVLDANSTLAGFDLRVSGRIEGSNFWIHEPSDAGVQLLAGSTIGAAPFDLRGGRISSSRTGSGTRLLDMQRTASTVLRDLTLEGGSFLQPAHNVRATTPHAVVMSNATGPMAGASFEDDPLGVITWGQGTRYLSGGTAGCLPMATCDGIGSPRIGTSGFAFECRGAHPFVGGVLLIGAPAPAPITVLGLQTSLDLLQPVISNYYGSDAQGRILAPQNIPADPFLVGLSAAAQFALLEPPNCTPSGLSTSNTVQVTIQP